MSAHFLTWVSAQDGIRVNTEVSLYTTASDRLWITCRSWISPGQTRRSAPTGGGGTKAFGYRFNNEENTVDMIGHNHVLDCEL